MIILKKYFVSFALAALLLSSTLPSAQAAEIYATNGHKTVNVATSYIGKVKYSFGTRDINKLIFDCSSFTQFVFKKNGISIPWGSKAQAKFGLPVSSKSHLAIGDLVFFSVSTPGQINHVGIYTGNGKFIHNLPNKGVIISDLSSAYWTSKYITARHY